jgi:tripartite-type tricarboxylate transporter receptor subunit TctC
MCWRRPGHGRGASLTAPPGRARAAISPARCFTWFGFFARLGTPEPARQALEAALLRAFATPAVQEKLQQASAVPLPARGAEFGRWYAGEVARWQGLVRQGKLARID